MAARGLNRIKRQLDFVWLRYLVAAAGLFFVIAGGVVSSKATLEVTHNRMALEQILSVVRTAQDLKLSTLDPQQDNMVKLFRRLELYGPAMHTVADDSTPPGFLINPWKDRLDFMIQSVATGNAAQPVGLVLDLATVVTPTACRVILGDLRQRQASNFIWQIAVEDSNASSASRQLVTGGQQDGRPKHDAIIAACGKAKLVKLKLGFKLFG
jgi:hypothetical protein